MIQLRNLTLLPSRAALARLPEGKLLINTINAYSYNNARKDALFEEALMNGDVLLPDGISIVRACHWLNAKSQPVQRVTGWDLFAFEMTRLEALASANHSRPKVMFLGSSEKVLSLIRKEAARVYPHLEVVTYSPPFKDEFSDEDNQAMVDAINAADPDLLWIGMTAPKQEKWAYSQWQKLNIHCHTGAIGAVFDFFAGTAKRAPMLWQTMGLEWLYRLLREPRRMWRRYIIGNTEFLNLLVREKFGW